MALIKKDNTNQFGVSETYYRITGINLNLHFKFCDITVSGYASKDARLQNKEPLNIRTIRAKWTDEEFGAYFSPRVISNNSIYNMAYEYIKQDDYFKDCEIDM